MGKGSVGINIWWTLCTFFSRSKQAETSLGVLCLKSLKGRCYFPNQIWILCSKRKWVKMRFCNFNFSPQLTFFWSFVFWVSVPLAYTFCGCSVAHLCPTLCDLMDCNMPGFPVLHYLSEFAQTHVHWVINGCLQPSCPLSSPYILCLWNHTRLVGWEQRCFANFLDTCAHTAQHTPLSGICGVSSPPRMAEGLWETLHLLFLVQSVQ